MVKSTVI